MKKLITSGVLTLTLAASGVMAPVQSNAVELAWDYNCGEGQEVYKDGTKRYVCEAEPNDNWRQAKEINMPASYANARENKRVVSLVGVEESLSTVDWWEITLPDERGNMSWMTLQDTGRGMIYVYDEQKDDVVEIFEYEQEHGKYTGKKFYYASYSKTKNPNYIVNLEYKANPAGDNPHEPNDVFEPLNDNVEYALVETNKLIKTTWSSQYDRRDIFGIEATSDGHLKAEIHYSDFEFEKWTHRDAYITYSIEAEKKDGTWTTLYSKAVAGIPNQTFTIDLDVNDAELSGVYLLNLQNSGFYDKNYEFKISFASNGEKPVEPPTDPEVPDEPSEQVFKRFDGKDRYDTNKLMNQDIEDGTLDHVIVASGRNFPDALAGGALTNIKNGTIVLVNDRDAVIEKTTNEIERMLKPKGKVLILGSDSVVSEKMVEKLEQQEIATQRIYGSTRIETAIEIAEEVNEDPSEIFLVDGFNFADALSIAPVSAKLNQPILMTKKQDKLPDSVVTYLDESNIKTVTIIGGTLAVGSPIEADLEAEGYTVNRISGSTRTETSLAVAKAYYPNASAVGIANGWQFPDALSGSAFAYRNNMPVILTSDKRISSSNLKWIKEDSKSVYFMGGISPLPKSLESEF
ncbi:hypothetical protein BHE17_04690 [Planococcus maritimus]|uniref:cell wall-binding repeat-containing protein n=1 Tax=Planococcus maritimus TaxID=192421 RepID=UPI00084C2FCD|nr:cell wall-binding repeat-containing protein [Planococcus maritimus]OED31773.1 hypothetical protein BHE17_04690 [Planococcus maritimus]